MMPLLTLVVLVPLLCGQLPELGASPAEASHVEGPAELADVLDVLAMPASPSPLRIAASIPLAVLRDGCAAPPPVPPPESGALAPSTPCSHP